MAILTWPAFFSGIAQAPAHAFSFPMPNQKRTAPPPTKKRAVLSRPVVVVLRMDMEDLWECAKVPLEEFLEAEEALKRTGIVFSEQGANMGGRSEEHTSE